jgi:tetratricopeptide (TPR) repeat protein
LKSKELLEEALPILIKHYSLNHFSVAITLTNLGNAYAALGNTEQQRKLLARAFFIFEERAGANNPNTLLVLKFLISAYQLPEEISKRQLFYEKWANFINDNSISLHLATQMGDIQLMQLLLAQSMGDPSANTHMINAKDKKGNTPLMWAAKEGRTDAAKLLLDAGAPINAKNKAGRTALYLAIKKGHLAVASALLDRAADIRIADNHDFTPLTLAHILLRLSLENKKKEWQALIERMEGISMDREEHQEKVELSLYKTPRPTFH